MKKIISTAIITAIVLTLFTSPVTAGPRGRHFARGLIIGTTAGIIGAAIINEVNAYNRPVYIPHRRGDRYCNNRCYPRGHWVYEKVWMPPVYEVRWNPGHYRHGHWVRGRNQRFMVKDGHWRRNRVWVSD